MVWLASLRRHGLPLAALGLLVGGVAAAEGSPPPAAPASAAAPLARIRVAPDGRGFVTATGRPFVPFGVTYYRPHTGWAPQVWKQFDPEATRRDFARMRALGVNCVRVFLSYGSFYPTPGALAAEGLAKFDQFLAEAEAAGIYVHPTGPDHWEGTPAWASGDRFADERLLADVETFWRLFAARYRGRPVIFAYDLLNEPELRWDTPAMRAKWHRWLAGRYGTPAQLARAWHRAQPPSAWDGVPVPPPQGAPGDPRLLDYQHFREAVAVEWTRRQVIAIKQADPSALVTIGLIQWSVPSLVFGVEHYSAFRPERLAPWLDFLEIHFYPLATGFYDYSRPAEEARNLAYLEGVTREVARFHKPAVLAEFGWYGGGQLTLDGHKHPPATEEQQARWCGRLVQTTAPLAAGWLNWGLYDAPGAGDVSQLTGLLTAEGQTNAWGRRFREWAAYYQDHPRPTPRPLARPTLDWDLCLTSPAAGTAFRDRYFEAFETQGGHEGGDARPSDTSDPRPARR